MNDVLSGHRVVQLKQWARLTLTTLNILYKPWGPKSYFQFKIIINVLVSFVRFILIPMSWVYVRYKCFSFSTQGSTLDVRFWRLNKFGPYTERVNPDIIMILTPDTLDREHRQTAKNNPLIPHADSITLTSRVIKITKCHFNPLNATIMIMGN